VGEGLGGGETASQILPEAGSEQWQLVVSGAGTAELVGRWHLNDDSGLHCCWHVCVVSGLVRLRCYRMTG